jgi:galactokinase
MTPASEDRLRADALAEHFLTVFGRTPDTIWFAPGRVNLIGDHTDYNLGFSLPFAVEFGVLAAAARRDDDIVRVGSLQFDGIAEHDMRALTSGRIDAWHSYVAGAAFGMREHGAAIGLDLMLDGDIPPGAGMSSSAALSCVTALAIDDLAGTGLPHDDIALIAQAAEHRFAGTPCGLLDQTASLHAQAGSVLLVDFRDMHVEHVPLDLSADLALLVIDTRAPHRLVDGEYASRRAACESACVDLGVTSLREIADIGAADLLDDERRRRVRHVISENQRVLDTVALLREGRTAEIGSLLTASHASMRDDFQNSVPEVDLAVNAAVQAGALGARMTGGGFGGSVVALIPRAQRPVIVKAITDAYAAAGFTAPVLIDVAPAQGARRLV